MPKDTTLLDNSGSPTLDQLKAHFQANDFTTEQSSYDPSKATDAQNQIYVKAKRFFSEEWDRQQKAMGGKGSLRNFSDAYPLQVLENANENQIAGTVTQILSDPNLTERIFTLLEPMILSALSTYAESVGKSCDDLTDEEVETVIALFADQLQGNAVNLLMQTENVPELLSELKLFFYFRVEAFNYPNDRRINIKEKQAETCFSYVKFTQTISVARSHDLPNRQSRLHGRHSLPKVQQ